MDKLKSQPEFRKAFLGAPVAAFFLLCAAPSRAELPPAAQAAFSKGVVAAQQQEWEIAVQSFQAARQAAPNAPEILYNLGLTESKMPGRELRAIAWFGAYLSADPKAANAKDVWAFIAALQVKDEGNIRRLIKTLESGARDAALSSHDGIDVHRLELDLAGLWADLGDVPNTERLVASAMTVDDNSSLWDKDWRNSAIYNEPLALAHANAGDLAAAVGYAARIPNLSDRVDVDIAIAEIERRAGDGAGARTTLITAASAAERVPQVNKAEEQAKVAEAQAQAGDLSGARITLLAAQKTLETPGTNNKDSAQSWIRKAQDAMSPAQSVSHPIGSSVADWTRKLDSAKVDDTCMDDCGLNRPMFLDFGGYLKAVASGEPMEQDFAIQMFGDRSPAGRFRTMEAVAWRAIHTGKVVDGMLKTLGTEVR